MSTVSRGSYIYHVEKLWELVKNENTLFLHIDLLKDDNMNSDNWCYFDKNNKEHWITPYQLLDRPELSKSHYDRVLNCDLDYPMLVYLGDKGRKFDIYDGLHRLSKYVLERKNFVKVVILDDDMLKKSILNETDKKKNSKLNK